MALYADTARVCLPTKPTMGDCSTETEVHAGTVALLRSEEASKSDVVSDPASHTQPTG